MSNARRQLDSWLADIDVKVDKVLDIGGLHLPVKGRTKSWEVKEYEILDCEEYYKGREPDFFADLNYEIEVKKQYDIIFCLEVMEYIWNPVGALKNIYNLLKPLGIAYISFHFCFPQHFPKGKDYLRYGRDGVRKLMEIAGLKIIDIKKRTPKDPELFMKCMYNEAKVVRGENEAGYLVKVKKYNSNPS